MVTKERSSNPQCNDSVGGPRRHVPPGSYHHLAHGAGKVPRWGQRAHVVHLRGVGRLEKKVEDGDQPTVVVTAIRLVQHRRIVYQPLQVGGKERFAYGRGVVGVETGCESKADGFFILHGFTW